MAMESGNQIKRPENHSPPINAGSSFVLTWVGDDGTMQSFDTGFESAKAFELAELRHVEEVKPFPFQDLPPELRNMIYRIQLAGRTLHIKNRSDVVIRTPQYSTSYLPLTHLICKQSPYATIEESRDRLYYDVDRWTRSGVNQKLECGIMYTCKGCLEESRGIPYADNVWAFASSESLQHFTTAHNSCGEGRQCLSWIRAVQLQISYEGYTSWKQPMRLFASEITCIRNMDIELSDSITSRRAKYRSQSINKLLEGKEKMLLPFAGRLSNVKIRLIEKSRVHAWTTAEKTLWCQEREQQLKKAVIPREPAAVSHDG